MPFLLKCGEGALAFYRLRAWKVSITFLKRRPWPPLPPARKINTGGREPNNKPSRSNTEVGDLTLYLKNLNRGGPSPWGLGAWSKTKLLPF